MKKTWQDKGKDGSSSLEELRREEGLQLWHAARDIGLARRHCWQRGTQSCLDER